MSKFVPSTLKFKFLPFSTSFLCQREFSTVAILKSKYGPKFNMKKEMRNYILFPNFKHGNIL